MIDLSKHKGSSQDRFIAMCASIQELIEKHTPDLVVFEDVSAQNGNVQTLKLLSRLQGFIIGVALANKIPFFVLAPSEWRNKLKFKQGSKVKRELLKLQAKQFIENELHLYDIQEDIAEALCIGFAFMGDTMKLKEI